MNDTSTREIYTVSRLNLEARGLLETRFPLIWVEGELSNVSSPASGHLYFTLKDPHAQVRAAMFRNRNRHLGFTPKAGLQVLARARVSLYEARGDYQLIVEHLEEAGEGALRRAFEELKNRLAAEGLFDAERKRQPPAYPHSLGVITSPTGAALRDVLSVLARRFPALPVYVYPVSVQGAGAAPSIIAALARANHEQRCDTLLLVRGGGSLEDLWAFNEEAVARAIADSEIPVVCGVGHETDITIADFTADLRAPTPSAAAELVSQDATQLLHRLGSLAESLRLRLHARVGQRQRMLESLQGRLARQHPLRRLQQHAQRIDELELRLHQSLARQQQLRSSRLQTLQARLSARSPALTLSAQTKRLERLRQELHRAMQERINREHKRLASLSRTLTAVSPLATLQRGYAIALAPGSLEPLRNTDRAHVDDRIELRLARGRLFCRVEKIEPEGGY
ncbi:MAG: exodeoxyribonuclease VII large subunit [Acidihalobacter sp.]|uniref:exodeoxyribonuclease VII large subunit n=1 Tax=Acidihalobacter sp. TaxID=1872108 RepID=UPI00307E0C0B